MIWNCVSESFSRCDSEIQDLKFLLRSKKHLCPNLLLGGEQGGRGVLQILGMTFFPHLVCIYERCPPGLHALLCSSVYCFPPVLLFASRRSSSLKTNSVIYIMTYIYETLQRLLSSLPSKVVLVWILTLTDGLNLQTTC